jgi:hypothetical protein
MKKIIISYVILFALSSHISAQVLPQKEVTPSFITAHFNDSLLINKHIDSTFKQQIRGALLFYPELKNIKIAFKIKKSITPLSARPRVWAIFQKPKNRKYLIVISSASIEKLEPILLKNLSFNAQVGVLGHELSHISDFNQRHGLYFVKLLFMQLSKKAMDIFENKTDRRAIEHGLGYQLLAWSTEVRQNLKIEQWNGVHTEGGMARERYMSPKTIMEHINDLNNFKQ